jgi:phosphohistidine phosphatase
VTETTLRLVLIRHAKAEAAGSGLRDFDRILIPRGMAAAQALGSKLKAAGVLPDLFLTSAAPRAVLTAELVAGVLGFGAVRPVDGLYDAEPEFILETARTAGLDRGTIFVCGHNPGISELLFFLAPSLARELPTASCAIVAFSASVWALADQGCVGSVEYFET